MAIPDGATHLVVSGTAASSESFAFGWWMNDSGASLGPDLDLSTPWQTFRDALLAHMTADQVITHYDLYRYAGGVVTTHEQQAVSHPGTDTSGMLPLQVSLVLTLRTATLSRRGRGRIYLPTCGFSMMGGTNHLFNSTPVNALVDAFANFLTTYGVGGATPVVVSRVGGVMEPITAVDADLVPDTQRRRRGKLSSTRHTATV